uniref:Phenazine biosynthesis-like domain-containing protein n=1 Tax=Haemonchus contortus TaxID=6289 RepID=A0A7I4YIX2_HAECO
MEQKYTTFIVDAFTAERFTGNQAAVCLIPRVLRDGEYQKIAAEFNLSETAFPIPTDGDFHTASKFSLRWFTPTAEVPLCGHATLASSHVLFNEIGNESSTITFATKSGNLVVRKGARKQVEMDFPQYNVTAIQFHGKPSSLANIFPEFRAPPHLHELIQSFIPKIIRVEAVAYASAAKKLIIVIDKETTNFELSQITAMRAERMVKLDPEGEFTRGVVVTFAPLHAMSQGFVDSEAEPYDYVCRYFAPWVGIMEDPATGSAQCALAPLWGAVLQKRSLYAYQSYPNRGAQFRINLCDSGRVSILGQSVTVLQGQIHLNEAIFY